MDFTELIPVADAFRSLLMAAYAISIFGTIAVVIGENRNPVKSLAWVTILLLLPAVGLVLYLFFGRSLKGKQQLSNRRLRRLRTVVGFPTPTPPPIQNFSEASQQVISLVNSLTLPHFFADNTAQVFTGGREKFEALLADLRAAKHYILLQYYIIEDDHIGSEVAQVLIAKAKEGVSVRVIYDHLGSFKLRSGFFTTLRRAGVEAYPFLKITFTQLANRLNWRNHRKLVVIDGTVGYIGGMNIADRYVTGEHHDKPWRDTHLRITGEAVVGLMMVFAFDWNYMQRPMGHLCGTSRPVRPIDPQATSCAMQVLDSGPMGKWNNISLVFLRAIGAAHRRVFVQTPYFLPNDALLQTLQSAALSGVDVRVMLPRKGDSRLLRYASCSYFKQCLQAGIKIYFYEPAMLHSKMLLIDDDFVAMGSTNFDFRSFEHNFECNVLVYSEAFNHRMERVFLDDQRCCTRVVLRSWRKRPIINKAIESIFRLMAPIL